MSADTIRYYERLGLMPPPPRSRAGYRLYSDAAVDRLRLVRNALALGFSLREVAGFLRVRERGGAPCHDVRAAADRILDALDRQIAELAAARASMRATLAHWDRRLAETPAGAQAHLLASLGPALARTAVPRTRLTRVRR